MSEIDITRKAMLKSYVSQVRLRYSLMADAEIERNKPELMELINASMAMGRTITLAPAEITVDGKSMEAIISGDAGA